MDLYTERQIKGYKCKLIEKYINSLTIGDVSERDLKLETLIIDLVILTTNLVT